MKYLDNDINTILSTIKDMNGNSSDITDRKLKIGKSEIAYIFLESVSSDDKISDFLVRTLTQNIKSQKMLSIKNIFEIIENDLLNSKVKIVETYEEVFFHMASGFTCIFVEGNKKAIVVETKTKLDRGITESTTEAIVRGPKDSFTENHMVNIGLIRKRIKDPNLWIKDVVVGRRTKTKVSITYIDDIAKKEEVNKIIQKIQKIDIDGILDSGYIRDFLNDGKIDAFPEFISTERPDVVCGSLLEGKVVILVENSPFTLVIPGTFLDFIHSPEDYYQKPINTTFTRILRLMAFFLTMLTPAVYIAFTTINQELIPDNLLISLSVQRQTVPFPTFIEVTLLLTAFEILRETDIRTPNLMGTAISVVGALVLGEAAVNAGIISPIVVIIVSITSISGLTFSDIDFINAIRCWRLAFILIASILGIFGVIVAAILLIVKLVSTTSYDTPYLVPISPFYGKEQEDAIARLPRTDMTKRPVYLTKNRTRLVKK